MNYIQKKVYLRRSMHYIASSNIINMQGSTANLYSSYFTLLCKFQKCFYISQLIHIFVIFTQYFIGIVTTSVYFNI